MKRFRKERIGSLVRDIVAESVQRKMNDPRVSPLTTVTMSDTAPSAIRFAASSSSFNGADTLCASQ